jgi:hypothetical protein
MKTPCGKKTPCKNNTANCKDISCLDCPLCYNFINQPLAASYYPIYYSENLYFHFEEDLVSDYFSKNWKPPSAS